jgi:hypothetical protein
MFVMLHNIIISQANVYSREGVCLGAVAEQESWVWTCKPRPGSNNNQVVGTISLVPRPIPCCNIENVEWAWGRG